MKPEKLWKTTLEIWTDYDPSFIELEDLAREATSGNALCENQISVEITNKDEFPDTEFFDSGDEDEDEVEIPEELT